ncbi:tyrosine-type recombinase/integrase [Aeromonas veronii]
MALSDSRLKAMLRGHDDDTPRKVADRDGLSVLWRNSGKVSFVYRYRILGKAKNHTLGSYTGQEGSLSLSEARKKAAQCRAWLEEGKDPALMMRIGKDERLRPVTVKDALEYWLSHHADKKRSNSEKHRQQFAKWIYPRIGDLPLSECDTRHWLSIFDEYSKLAPVASGYCFQNCKHALKFCRVRQFAVSNALDDLAVSDVGKKASKRDRVLTLEELQTLWDWAEKLDLYNYYGNLVKIQLSFGARTKEVRLSEPEEWNLVEGTWTVPASHSKTGNKIVRPIPDFIQPTIEALLQVAAEQASPYLLGELKRPEAVSQWGRGIWKRIKHKSPWTLHDLRRSLATRLNEAGVAPHVVEQMLGHALPGVMAHYVHTVRLPEQKAAFALWGGILGASLQMADNVRHLQVV